MAQEPSNNTPFKVGCLTAAAVIIAAIIGLGLPFAQRLADRYLPPFTPTPIIISSTQAYQQPEATQAASNPVIPPFAQSTPLPIQPAMAPTNNVQCSHFQVSSTPTMIPVGMWVVTRTCSPARSACFYAIEQSSGGEYSSYEHNGTADRRWVNVFCTEAEAKNFANTDAKAMLEWWPSTNQSPLP
jgi:hypothetical protein